MSKGSFGNLPDIKIIIGDGSEKPIEFSLICKTFGINSPEEMVAAYGKLYNWYAVDDTRGLCPEGWSVPSDDDWTVLVNYVVSQGFPNEWNNPNGAGNALKSCRQEGHPDGGNCDTSEHPRWNSFSPYYHYGFDKFGFSALPGGGRWSYGGFISAVLAATATGGVLLRSAVPMRGTGTCTVTTEMCTATSTIRQTVSVSAV